MSPKSLSQLPAGVRLRDGKPLSTPAQSLSALMESFLCRELDVTPLGPDLPSALLGAGVPVGLRNELHFHHERERDNHDLEFARLLYSDALRDDAVFASDAEQIRLSALLAPKDVRRVATFACGWGAGVQQIALMQNLDVTGFASHVEQTEYRLNLLQDADLLPTARVVHTGTVLHTSADTFDAVYCPRADFRSKTAPTGVAQLVERVSPGGQLLIYWFDSGRGMTRQGRAWQQVARALAPLDWAQTMSLASFARRVDALGCVIDDAGDATASLEAWLGEQLTRWAQLDAEVGLAFGEREYRTQQLLRSFALWAARERLMRYRWAVLRRL